MAVYYATSGELGDIADAIRTKGGTSADLEFPTGFVNAIDAISTVAPNVVTGTFKGTTAGSTEITIPYNGSGYPVSIVIYPAEGANDTDGTFGSAIDRFKYAMFALVKADAGTAPLYMADSTADSVFAAWRHKNSTTSATVYGGGQAAVAAYNTNAASSSAGQYTTRFKNAKTLVVYMGGTNYGYMLNVDYHYTVTYSS